MFEKLILKGLAIFLALLIFSCAEEKKPEFDVIANENALKRVGTFNTYLALEYLDFSRNLAAGKNKKDAQYFLNKSSLIAQDKVIVPENPIDWKADPTQIEELVAMQKRLDIISTPQLQNQLPIQLAHLTYLYDCWVAKESQPIFKANEIAKCRGRFYKLLEEIEFYVDKQKEIAKPETKITEPEFKRFEILFDLASYKFNDKANKDFLKILDHLMTLNGNYRLLLVGSADRTGKELLNKSLALKRVETVKNYLIKNGVTQDLIATRSFGEDFPDIITSKGAQEQGNRAVGIYVLKGANSFESFPLPLIENFVYREGVQKARRERGLK
ncbi:MAG: OmpA family protein [Rickettsiales bacterium]|nr:OmpA family protein [Rickettsiales bacterium]